MASNAVPRIVQAALRRAFQRATGRVLSATEHDDVLAVQRQGHALDLPRFGPDAPELPRHAGALRPAACTRIARNLLDRR
jgi:hypothetical protein